MAKKTPENAFDRIPFRMHPRVFAALGADLVTNDVVAVIELVKNSYDAFARNVWVRFCDDAEEGPFLEVEDDGQGMTRKIIQDVWCVVATPNKSLNPRATSGTKVRRVVGEKGLGRLSAARLGSRLNILTQALGSSCLELNVNWSRISNSRDLSACFAECKTYAGDSPFGTSGTRVRIYGLKTKWDEGTISDLQDNLSRLLSPFSAVGDFNISLVGAADDKAQAGNVTSPAFLSKPKYLLKGKVDRNGNIKGNYLFSPIVDGKTRENPVTRRWEQIYDGILDKNAFPFIQHKAHCGPFSFEIRAWDIGLDDTQEISDRFDFRRSSSARPSAHKGISVYRDKILVLPKSDKARDWLGLDLRASARPAPE